MCSILDIWAYISISSLVFTFLFQKFIQISMTCMLCLRAWCSKSKKVRGRLRRFWHKHHIICSTRNTQEGSLKLCGTSRAASWWLTDRSIRQVVLHSSWQTKHHISATLKLPQFPFFQFHASHFALENQSLSLLFFLIFAGYFIHIGQLICWHSSVKYAFVRSYFLIQILKAIVKLWVFWFRFPNDNSVLDVFWELMESTLLYFGKITRVIFIIFITRIKFWTIVWFLFISLTQLTGIFIWFIWQDFI